MTVKDGRELLSKRPVGMSQQEFDDMPLFVKSFDDDLMSPCNCNSGVIEVYEAITATGRVIQLPDNQIEKVFLFGPHEIDNDDNEDEDENDMRSLLN